MTTEAALPATSASPTVGQVWTRARGVLIAVVLLLIGAVATAVIRSGAQYGSLDPRSTAPYGSHAVATLLAERGVTTRVVTTLDEARTAVGPDTTLLITVPDLLTPQQQQLLHGTTRISDGRTVLIAPRTSLDTLAPGLLAAPAAGFDSTLPPGCRMAAARQAGAAETGGMRYRSHDARADTCYPSEGLPTLVRLPAASGDGDTVVLGSPRILYNDRLDEQGNASLALQLLGSRSHLVWYLPSLSDSSASDAGEESFLDLLPSGWLWGTLQLFVAAALAALWRARRLGPLVPEKLPVVIRASETVEGRARLYRKANARDRAAAALRSTTRTRLAPLVGVSSAQAHTPEALLPALSTRLGGDGHPPLHALLFGPPPGDDAALIALADQLDALESEVRRP
ncbi:DUF4350 domain-containing protein [Streptomyces sp. SID2888]|uniref:DUF4350 domain-containing protein n=1 Tax=Streptomyces sp. SID2888 TaxID=2690256 RepID=UPI00136B51FA|nr:DUF4350 domain-containing protein [Streptomyces sp. SID2888]MYV46998.1 DUF4350 domain-containing protein [Streptomyces sp. SID2888]